MSTRARVLSSFRKLHRTRQRAFEGDVNALKAGRLRINSEFKNNLAVTEADKIEELITIAEDAERLLRTSVVQARLTSKGTYEVKITDETALQDNTPFKDNVILPRSRRKKCSDATDS